MTLTWPDSCEGRPVVIFRCYLHQRQLNAGTCSSGGQQAPDILQSPGPQATATVVTGVSVRSTGFLCGC